MKKNKYRIIKKFAPAILVITLLTSCYFGKGDAVRKAHAESICSQMTKIEGFPIYFHGYLKEEADSIEIKIKRNNEIIERFKDKISEIIEDSELVSRSYHLQKEILLTDTLLIKIKPEPEKKIYGFKYLTVPYCTMFSCDWECEFKQLTVDGKMIEGGYIDITKTGWHSIDRKDFKAYYHKK